LLLLGVRVIENGHRVSDTCEELHDNWWTLVEGRLVTLNAPILRIVPGLVVDGLRHCVVVGFGCHALQAIGLMCLEVLQVLAIVLGNSRLEAVFTAVLPSLHYVWRYVSKIIWSVCSSSHRQVLRLSVVVWRVELGLGSLGLLGVERRMRA
jgi:hypothetical protein